MMADADKDTMIGTLEKSYVDFRDLIVPLPNEAYREVWLGDWDLNHLLAHMAGWAGGVVIFRCGNPAFSASDSALPRHAPATADLRRALQDDDTRAPGIGRGLWRAAHPPGAGSGRRRDPP